MTPHLGRAPFIEDVSFFSEGTRLEATLFRPPDAALHERRPGVVLCHGYNGVRKLYLPDAARALAAAGYIALTFDYKGWGGSDGPPLRLDPYGRVFDMQAAVTYLSVQPGIDRDRIGAFGWSFGGSVAIWCAAFDRRVASVVSIVGVGDGPRWMRSVRTEEDWVDLLKRGDLDRLERLKTGRSRLCERSSILHLDPESQRRSAAARSNTSGASDTIPAEFIDETLSFRPEFVVGQLSPTPLLLIACGNDEVVPAAESEGLFGAAGDPKRLIILEGYGHYDVYSGEAFDRVMGETLDWFENSIGRGRDLARPIDGPLSAR